MQEILVSLIMLAAVAWVVRNLYRQFTGKKQCSCADGKGHCGGGCMQHTRTEKT